MTGKFLFRRQNPRIFSSVACLLSALGFWSLPLHADWLHYRGPSQNGVSPEKGWNAQLAASPKVLWKTNVGKGTSSVTISGHHAFTMGNTDGKEVVVCLDTRTGKEVWRHEYPLELDANMFEGGPRSTPTLDGSHVYIVSHQGDLWCLEAKTGKPVWQKHYQKDFGGRRPTWGFAGSPLVSGNLLVCDIGGPEASTVAFDKASGKVVWKSGSDAPGYASPVVANLDGTQTVVVFKAENLVGMDLKDGRELWRSPWKTSYDVNAATPLILGDKIFISSGYGTGCSLLRVSGGQIAEVWRNKNLRSQINSPSVWQGAIFGLDGNTNGNLVCIDAASGEKKWDERSTKGGALIISDGKLIQLTEKGELVIAEASPAGFRAIARAAVLPKRCWVQPTLDSGLLFVKNNEGELACLDLRAR